jgi:hypothetical protein
VRETPGDQHEDDFTMPSDFFPTGATTAPVLGEVGPGHTVAVFGVGPVGLMAAPLARLTSLEGRIEVDGALPSSMVTAANFLIAFVIGASAGTAVFFHATRHGIKHPSAWASVVFLFLAIGLPAYVIHVRRLRRRRQP